AAIWAKGLVQFAVVPGTGYDLQLRWTETQYYLRGANPFEASFYHNDVARGGPTTKEPTYFPDLRSPQYANYPPTSTLTEILLFGLPLAGASLSYVAINLAAFVTIGWWAFKTTPAPIALQLTAVGAALANLGYSQTIVNGNLGVIVMAALTAAVQF